VRGRCCGFVIRNRPNKSKSTKVGLYLKGQDVNACKKPDCIDPLADIEMSRRLGAIIWAEYQVLGETGKKSFLGREGLGFFVLLGYRCCDNQRCGHLAMQM
jgi:hypothetical protein